jgi:hypothetical protein
VAQILDVLDPGAALWQVAEGLAEYPLLATHLGGVGGRIGERGSVAAEQLDPGPGADGEVPHREHRGEHRLE